MFFAAEGPASLLAKHLGRRLRRGRRRILSCHWRWACSWPVQRNWEYAKLRSPMWHTKKPPSAGRRRLAEKTVATTRAPEEEFRNGSQIANISSPFSFSL